MRYIAPLLPIIGIILFIGLYIYAASMYPGGSQADLNTIGYDWMHNYWCNLTNELAMNGEPNPARPIAIFALWVLCISFLAFFLLFPQHVSLSPFWNKAIPVSGILSMLTAAFIFSDFHDEITIISSLAGLLAVIGVIVGILKNKLKVFAWGGLLCLLALAANNIIYYSETGIEYLPLIQKISFVLVLSWVAGLCVWFFIKSSTQPKASS